MTVYTYAHIYIYCFLKLASGHGLRVPKAGGETDQADGWMDGWTDQADGWMDGWADLADGTYIPMYTYIHRYIHSYIYTCVHAYIHMCTGPHS
jgi:hypothetical protein